MKNILSIDFGTKRWGLAFCDELRVVFTVPAATQGTHTERLAYLERVMKERRVDTLVLGLPYGLDGQETEMTKAALKFRKSLEVYDLPIHTVDEGLSSFAAEASIPKKKVKQGRAPRDGTVDSKAAAILLEEFLDQTDDSGQ